MSTPLKVQAVLTGQAVSGVAVQVYRILLNGTVRAIGSGKTDAKGAVTINCNWGPTGDYQPRLQLRALQGKTYVVLTESVASFKGNVVDFGSVPLKPVATPVVMTNIPIIQPLTVVTPKAEKAPEPQVASVMRVLESTSSGLKTVNTAMLSSGYRLGNISLQLKVLPSAEGLLLPKADEITKLGSQGLSTLNVDLKAGGGPGTATKAEPLLVPSVTGFTESFARRKLGASNLQVATTWQLVDKEEDVGRVVLQRPVAGTQVKPRDTIIIAIGKKD